MTGREHDVVNAFINLSDRLVEDFDVVEVTTQLTEECAKLLGVAAAGLLLADVGGVLHLLAATSQHVRTLEVFQLQSEEGPCLDCFASGEAVSVADLGAERDRWPRFSAVALDEGYAAVHAIPMRLRDEVLGTLGLFGTSPGALDQDELAVAQALAHIASLAIAQQSEALPASQVLTGLQTAVASRRLLEIAKGVVAESQGISMEEAFTRLRVYARLRTQRLSEVAYLVVSETPVRRAALLTELADVAKPTPRSRD